MSKGLKIFLGILLMSGAVVTFFLLKKISGFWIFCTWVLMVVAFFGGFALIAKGAAQGKISDEDFDKAYRKDLSKIKDPNVQQALEEGFRKIAYREALKASKPGSDEKPAESLNDDPPGKV